MLGNVAVKAGFMETGERVNRAAEVTVLTGSCVKTLMSVLLTPTTVLLIPYV